ncbi:MAG: extracellular solute-binding protein [Firmicutes bacterium]|nr:extracellular solute-binding protein [Bacillota bacterium]
MNLLLRRRSSLLFVVVLVVTVMLGSMVVHAEKLRVVSSISGGKTAEESELFAKEVGEALGLEVEWIRPSGDEYLQTALRSGERFDLIYLNTPFMDQLVDQGALLPLTDFIKNSPILSDPTVIPTEDWEMIRYPDGHIYSVFNKYEGGTLPTVRADWLEKLGLEVPQTLDDFYNVLKAFVEQDPDGNGIDDTYGLSTSGLYDIQGFMGAFGVKARYVIDEDGRRTIPYASEAAIPAYEWLNMLYREGLLDPNFVTNSTADMRNLFLADRVGMVTYWDMWVGLFNATRLQEDPNTEFRAMGIAGPEGPNGERILRRGDPSIWAIPANAQNPEGAKRFLEFWHTEAGIILGSVGVKGYDYIIKEDGTMELTEIGVAHNMDHGVPRWYNTNVEAPFGSLPGVKEAEVFVNKYATLEISTADWPRAEAIVNDYAFRAITGQMTAEAAVKKMHEELMAANLIDY